MFFVASEKSGLYPCPGGPYKCKDGTPAIKAITWKQVDALCSKLNSLNPYDPNTVSDILKVEGCNYDRGGKQHQLLGLAVSAKRYVVYTQKHKNKLEIIKPSEHGLGSVYVPDKRSRYMPNDCKDTQSTYPLWIVETWKRLLSEHFKGDKDPETALISRQLWFEGWPAIMRLRITTPNVLKALRKRHPEVAKPYNFVHSPILIQPSADCTLIAPTSKHPEEWLTREYTEIHTGEAVKLGTEYKGKTLTPQTLSNIIWRHFLHPEDKSPSPHGEPCNAYTRGLLLRRPVEAITPLVPIGKEIERRSQEGEDISVFDNVGPVQYHPRKTANTRPADAALIQRASRFSKKLLRRKSGVSQHAIDRFLIGGRVHPVTRKKLAQTVEGLERKASGVTEESKVLELQVSLFTPIINIAHV